MRIPRDIKVHLPTRVAVMGIGFDTFASPRSSRSFAHAYQRRQNVEAHSIRSHDLPTHGLFTHFTARGGYAATGLGDPFCTDYLTNMGARLAAGD